jgi:hypothetical protein
MFPIPYKVKDQLAQLQKVCAKEILQKYKKLFTTRKNFRCRDEAI